MARFLPSGRPRPRLWCTLAGLLGKGFVRALGRGSAYALGGVLLLASAAQASQQPRRPDTSSLADRKAQALFVQGMTESYLEDYDEAVSYFEKALSVSPQAPAILEAMSEAEAARDNVTSALYYARQARDRGTDPHYHQTLAELLRTVNRPQEAAATYQALLETFPEYHRARLALARLQTELNRPQAALQTYQTLVDSSDRPQSASVYADMLRLYKQVGDEKGQERALQALIRRRHAVRAHRRQLAQLYVEQGRYQDAIPLYESLLRETPKAPRLLSRLQQLYEQTGRTNEAETLWRRFSTGKTSPDQQVARARSLYEEARRSATRLDSSAVAPARALLRSVLDVDSTHVGALDLLGTLHYETGAYARAAALLQQALDHNPRAAERWETAASALLKAGQSQQAVAVAEEGRLLFPGRPALLRTLATAKLRLNENEAARTHYQAALQNLEEDGGADSTRAALYAGLGRAHGQLDQPHRATEAFETALHLDRNQLTALVHYALRLAEQSSDRALTLAKRAVSAHPSSPAAHAALGWVTFNRGAAAKAKRHFRDAIEAGPAPAWVYKKFGDLYQALGNDRRAQQYWKKALDRAPHRDALQNKLDALPNS